MCSPLHQFMQANFPQTSPLQDFLSSINNTASKFEAEDVSSLLAHKIVRDDAIIQCKETPTTIVVATKRTKAKKLSRRQNKSNRKQHSPPPPKSKKCIQSQKNRWALAVSPVLQRTTKSAVPKRPQRLQSMECLPQLPVESSATHTSTVCQESRPKMPQRLESTECFSTKTNIEVTGDDRPQRPSRYASIEMLPQIVSDDRPQRPSRYASIEMLPQAADSPAGKPSRKASMEFTPTPHKRYTSGARHQEKMYFVLST